MKATPEQRATILAYQRDKKLVQIANEYKRGLLTDQDYTDRTVETVLVWLVREEEVEAN